LSNLGNEGLLGAQSGERSGCGNGFENTCRGKTFTSLSLKKFLTTPGIYDDSCEGTQARVTGKFAERTGWETLRYTRYLRHRATRKRDYREGFVFLQDGKLGNSAGVLISHKSHTHEGAQSK